MRSTDERASKSRHQGIDAPGARPNRPDVALDCAVADKLDWVFAEVCGKAPPAEELERVRPIAYSRVAPLDAALDVVTTLTEPFSISIPEAEDAPATRRRDQL